METKYLFNVKELRNYITEKTMESRQRLHSMEDIASSGCLATRLSYGRKHATHALPGNGSYRTAPHPRLPLPSLSVDGTVWTPTRPLFFSSLLSTSSPPSLSLYLTVSLSRSRALSLSLPLSHSLSLPPPSFFLSLSVSLHKAATC